MDSALEIGGLESKLYGAKDAGVRKVLIPYENKRDLDIIKLEKYNKDLINSLEIVLVNNIWEVLQLTLMDKISLNNYLAPKNLNYHCIYNNFTYLDSSKSINFDYKIKTIIGHKYLALIIQLS